MSRAGRVAAAFLSAGAAAAAYGSLYELNAFTLRRFQVPVLKPGTRPIRLLQISDLHLLPTQERKIGWVRALAELHPDVVVNTGDTWTSVEGLESVIRALEPLMQYPGVFVPGNADYYKARAKSPTAYFNPTAKRRVGEPLPWRKLSAAMAATGWRDLTHTHATLTVRGVPIALAGLDDPHLRRARYAVIAGQADPSAAVRIGVLHSPEPSLLGSFAADGYDLALAGHTHGGQVRIPFGPAVVTNCGIDVRRARWLHRWDEHMYLHVCAGLGTNPYLPIRFACRPEASLLTLIPRPARNSAAG